MKATGRSIGPEAALAMLGLLALFTVPTVSAATAAAAGQADSQPPGNVDLTGGNFPWDKSYSVVPSGPWTGPRLPDGQPDVQGSWSNTIANHNSFTDPQGGIPNDPHPRGAKGPRNTRAPSRVTDPEDGQVPFQPWALDKVRDSQAHFWNPTQPQYIEPVERCAPAGIPKSLYFLGYEIGQYPGYVVFFFDTGTRIVHLDGKPHLPAAIQLWNGDSRGHWEGNTLVVEVRNQNGKAMFSRSGEFMSEHATIEERYIFANDGSRYTYQARITDPTVFTRPFTVTVPERRWSEKDKPNEWHYAATPAKHSGKQLILEPRVHECVENNEGFALGSIR